MALKVNHNVAKKVFQLTFQPMLLEDNRDYASELRAIGETAKMLKETGEVDRCVVLVNGNSGNTLSGVSPSDVTMNFVKELSGFQSFVEIIDSVIIASPDVAATMLLKFARSLPEMEAIKDKISVLR